MNNTTTIFIVLLASVGLLMTSAIIQNVHAKIPQHSYLSLPLVVELYTNGQKVKGVTLWAEYKDEVQKFKWNMKGELEHAFKFSFPPMERGWFDFYRVCVQNDRTDQVQCQNGYWFPGTDSTYMRVLVP